MSNLVEREAKAIEKRRLFRRGERILVAVSGGLDSMVLLHVLNGLASEHGWKLAVGHFNHRLRGRSSEADERFVRETARRMGLRVFTGGADVRDYAGRRKMSVEMASRDLRHKFLARAARKFNARCIALAHHADDQVELFFLRLLRGAGGEGVGGMKWSNPSPTDAGIRLMRPLLEESREALAAWAREKGVKHREDASNARLDIRRNRLRHELLPLLKRHYQPALSRVIQRQMEIVGAEAEFVGAAAREWLRKRQEPFESLSVALQRRCLQLQLAAAGVLADFDLVEQLREVANLRVSVNAESQVSRTAAGRVLVHRGEKQGRNPTEVKLDFRGEAGEACFGDASFIWAIHGARGGTFRAPRARVNNERFDADKVGRGVILRHWRPGDRFQPIGMGSPVKLQDLFVNRKIAREQRHRLVVATTMSGEVFWVEGLRLGERFKLDRATKRQLQWQWKRV